jgi:hypothetical protein
VLMNGCNWLWYTRNDCCLLRVIWKIVLTDDFENNRRWIQNIAVCCVCITHTSIHKWSLIAYFYDGCQWKVWTKVDITSFVLCKIKLYLHTKVGVKYKRYTTRHLEMCKWLVPGRP